MTTDRLEEENARLKERVNDLRIALHDIANLDMTEIDRPTPYHLAICALGKDNELSAQQDNQGE